MSLTRNTTALGPIEEGDLCANDRVLTQSFPGSIGLEWGSRGGRHCKTTMVRSKYGPAIMSVLQRPRRLTDIIALDKDGNYEVKYTRVGDGTSSIGITKGDEVCLISSCDGTSPPSAYFTIANGDEQRGSCYELQDGQSVAFEVKAGKASQITGGESQISPPTLFTMHATDLPGIETLAHKYYS